MIRLTQDRLSLRRRRRRRRQGRQELAGRQGREPRRDGLDRPAGAAGLHHHDRRCAPRYYDGWRGLPRRACAPRSPTGIAHIEAVTGKTLRRRRRSAARLGPLGRARVDAGHDGHGPQPRPQRRDRGGPRRDLGRRALRLGQLSPLHPDVLGRRARPRPWRVRGSARDRQGGQGRPPRHRADAPKTGRRWSPNTRRWSSARLGPAVPAGRRTTSSGARSARCSASLAVATAPRSIAA